MDTKKILNILENALHISVNGKVILDKRGDGIHGASKESNSNIVNK